MCLLVLALDAHPRYRLVVAANRDEFHRRPSAPADFWPERPELVAGRDLEAGGTWLGLTRGGRFAALTNFREPGRHRPGAPSRGALAAEFLQGSSPPLAFLAELRGQARDYNGFSLVVGDRDALAYLSNRGPGPLALAPGVHGLSNHLLDTPWPKVERSRARLAALLSGRKVDPEELLELLSDRTVAPDAELPSTGLPLELERRLSPPMVVAPDYGTRCSTAVLVGRDDRVRLVEQSFGPNGEPTEERDFAFGLAEA